MKVDQERYAEIRRDYPETGKWLLRNESVNFWLAPDSSAVSRIWLNGIPGAGKNTLALLLTTSFDR
jgi:hypothetical protein